MSPPNARPRCSSKTAKGKPCKRTSIAGTDPPQCVSHAGLVGRKTDLSDEVTRKLVDLLRAGNYVEVAVKAAGIGRRTFYDWRARGAPENTKAADKPFRDFRERIELARAEGEARNVALVAKAAGTDWKAAAWMLERQFPDRWGRQTTRAPGDPPAKEVANPFDDLDATADELAARRKARASA